MKEILEQFGLSSKAARIYLSLLELGQADVTEIAHKTKLPRSTIYSVLPELQKVHLVFEFDQGKVRQFSPQDPKILGQQMLERERTIKEALPDLKRLYKSGSLKPHVTYYVGTDEFEQMYNSILSDRTVKHYDIVAREELWLQLDRKFFEQFKRKRAARSIKTRMILEYSDTAKQRQSQEVATLSQVKILPPAFSSPFEGGCYIFANKVIFVAYKKECIAVEIVSQEITSVVQMMFNFIWHSTSRSD